MLKNKIIELKQQLIQDANLVDEMITKSMHGLLTKNHGMLDEVINTSEPRVNDFDRSIDKMSVELIAQFEPVAKDLRLSLMIIKMNKDLERIADHMVNVCQSARVLVADNFEDTNDEIKNMSQTALMMFKDSIKAFSNEDVALANSICDRDQIVDEAGDQILKRLTVLMHSKKNSIASSLHIMRIAYNLERIADLSTNIAEEVIYIVQGEDIKHQHLSS